MKRASEFLDAHAHDPVLDDVLGKWVSVLDRLEEDPMQLVHEVDWVMKNISSNPIRTKKTVVGMILGSFCWICNFMTSNVPAGCII